MLKLFNSGVYYVNGEIVSSAQEVQTRTGTLPTPEEAGKNTMSYSIVKAHNQGKDMGQLYLKFDSMTSHDITYVDIIQTARASDMERFPMPYVLINCCNSLCAVGGTINEDDHKFALSAALAAAGIKSDPENTDIGSAIFANMPGDGNAREQAASCQRVMGGGVLIG